MLGIFLILSLWPILIAGQYSFPFVQVSDCSNANDFFNSANQRCESCNASTTPSTDLLSCVCQTGYRKVLSTSEPSFTCELCTGGANIAVTSDGLGCVECGNGTIFDATARTCTCAPGQSLVERFENGTVLAEAQCVSCTGLFSGPSSDNNVCSACPICSCLESEDGVCITTLPFTPPTSDVLFISARASSAYQGCLVQNITACQLLSNLCVMEYYDIAALACSLYSNIFERASNILLTNGNTGWFQNLPWIYYNSLTSTSSISNSLLTNTEITTSFSFKGLTNVLNLEVLKYDVNGSFLGSESAVSGILQLCMDRPSVKSAAFLFGTTYQSACSIPISDLQSNYPAQFYELNMRYTGANGDQLLPIPILITNYVGDGTVNNLGINPAAWVFVKRFSLVDNLVGADNTPQTVRHAQQLELVITLQQPTNGGLIYLPYLKITYADTPITTSSVQGSFFVNYQTASFNGIEGLKISLSVLGVLGALYAFSEASNWGRRQGLEYIGGESLMILIYYAMANTANVFFLVMLGYSTVTLLLYKGQATVTTLLPSADLEYLFTVFIAVAFAFKMVEVLGMIILQSFVDVFLIDWERPKNSEVDGKVSIWRTYFIANEWNEIQTSRKISFSFQLFAVIFFLEVVGFKSLALENPSVSLSTVALGELTTPDVYVPVYNKLLRFAVSALIFIVIDVLQVFYVIAIHERFIHDQIREFVDLCSVCNVSVFILANRRYGYYIHGRSVHGKADTDMLDMNEMLKKEQANLTTSRGLEGDDQQTFEISVPAKFREQFDRIYQPIEQSRSQPAARSGAGDAVDARMMECTKAYTTMKNFLTAFLEHRLRGFDYNVRNKMFLENLLDMEVQVPLPDSAFFYNASSVVFTQILFYGREFALLTFDILLFTIVDYTQENFVLAAVITYLVGKVLVVIRQFLGQQNLANKTLVDKRFLI